MEETDKDLQDIQKMADMLKDITKDLSSIQNLDLTNLAKQVGANNIPEALRTSMQQYQEPQKPIVNPPISTVKQCCDKKPTVLYINQTDNIDPEFAKVGDSGFDLRSSEDLLIEPMTMGFVGTGLFFQIPQGYEMQVRSRSGIALKQQCFVLNQPGTVDSGYRGEIKVMLFNLGKNAVKIEKGDRVAQGVICPVYGQGSLNLLRTNELDNSQRGNTGFGESGIK